MLPAGKIRMRAVLPGTRYYGTAPVYGSMENKIGTSYDVYTLPCFTCFPRCIVYLVPGIPVGL